MFGFDYEINLPLANLPIDMDNLQYYGSIERWPFNEIVDLRKTTFEITKENLSYNLKFKSVGKAFPEIN